ncbi:MAG: choice-of-anchor J domain-containing protein, partial [Fluviicola sp.]|nr:choice-of-anchor J domain-containing protein [Fluviicola sp.]
MKCPKLACSVKFLMGTFAILLSVTLSYGQTIQINKTPYQDQIIYKSQVGPDGYIHCATMENDSILRANNPGMSTLHEQELWLQQKIEEFKAEQALNPTKMAPILTIPMVVHVIHNGDAYGVNENIVDGQVLSQVQVLNEDFRRMLGTNGYNTNPVGADIEIEFCMAVVDPNGNPTNGIDRVNEGIASFTGLADVNAIKPNSSWDPTQYMNMWTVNYGNSGLLGFAQFPDNSGLPGLNANGGAANTDGVVADYRTFGSVQIFPGGNYSAPYDLGRTMTHEVGHWLGLRHIWGDANCGDDFCADTPTQQGSTNGCPTPPVTCGGPLPNQIENYMDYSTDICMNIFTLDQKTRIRTVMTVSPRRASLASSTVCTPLIADDAGIFAIVSPVNTICGTNFTPIVTLRNYGNTTLTSVTINYDVDGGPNQVFNWSGSLASLASVNVVLPGMTSTAGPHVFNASTALPNGNADGNTVNDASLSNFILSVATGTAPPIAEGFIGAAFAPVNWSINNGGNAITWVRSATQGNAPTAGNSAVIDNYSTNTTGNVDDLVMPLADLTGLTSAQLQFDVAYARYDATFNDQLDVMVSTDCGQTYTSVFSKASSVLATDPDQTTAYTAPTTWRTEIVDLTLYIGNNNVEILFRNLSGYGQNLYLDNINLTGVSSTSVADFTAAPNPACVGQTVTYTDASTNATSWAWTFGAGATPATATGAGPHTVVYSTAGTKTVGLAINGGAATTSQNVVINAIPAAPVVTVVDNCGSSTLTATGVNLLWSTAETTSSITVTTGGAYTVTQTVAGCTSANGSGTANPTAIPAAPTVTVVDNCGSSTLTA